MNEVKAIALCNKANCWVVASSSFKVIGAITVRDAKVASLSIIEVQRGFVNQYCVPLKYNLNMNEKYLKDFSSWINQTAQLLRERRWHEIDVQNLIEEVEDLGKSERRGIASQLTRLLLHLLKWQYQPQRRSDSWLDSITDARTQIELTIEDSPSLRSYPAEQLEDSYQRARRQAAKQTSMKISVFPEACPYSLELVLAEDWLPES